MEERLDWAVHGALSSLRGNQSDRESITCLVRSGWRHFRIRDVLRFEIYVNRSKNSALSHDDVVSLRMRVIQFMQYSGPFV